MDFIQFCRAHGIVMDYLPPVGRWVRFHTEDKHGKKNGAVKFMGDHGFCQNWATMTEPVVWNGGENDVSKYRRIVFESKQQDMQNRAKAAERAKSMLSTATLTSHPYFERKGFPELMINVLDGEALIPMYKTGLVGLQRISEDGTKKFLYGQETNGASFRIGNGPVHFICEGYATGLSLQEVLRHLKISYSIFVAFSAHNMKNMPRQGFVIADNDVSGTGQRVASEIGLPHWLSDVEGEDFNDAWLRLGTFKLSMQIRRLTMRK